MTTTTFDDMSTSRIVGRVRLATEDFCRLYIELRNGQVVTVDGTTPFDFTVGSVVLVTPDGVAPRLVLKYNIRPGLSQAGFLVSLARSCASR